MCASHRILAVTSVVLFGCMPSAESPPGEGGAIGNKGTGGRSNQTNNGSGGVANGGGSPGDNTSGGISGSGGRTSGGSGVPVAGGGTAGGGVASSSGGTAGGLSGSGGAIGPMACAPGVPVTTQLPRMKNSAYDAVIRDLLGVTSLGSANNQPPSSLLAPDSAGSLTDIAWNGYLTAAEQIAAAVMAGSNKSKFIGCDPAGEACLTTTIKTFGRKAFRRPVTDAEVTSLLRLNNLTPKGTGNEVAEGILFAILASPSFIMLPELAQDKEGSSIKLSSHEVAARLSFLLWGSVPDDELNAAADAGQLSTKDQIAAQAQRMLKSDKAKAVVNQFHHYYAGIEPGSHWVNNNEHDTSKYPTFTAASYAPAMTEIDSFFEDVVLGGGSFRDLFLSNAAFVTKDTAPLYGLSASAYGTQPTRVELDATKRPGFLTRVGFLSTFSKYSVTSPILRGAFISGRVLGVDPGTPDPAFVGMTPPAGNYTTQRQAIEALTKSEPCFSCHAKTINPAGFVMERYNSVGAWQDKDPLGGDIDSTADVRLSASDTKTLASPFELMTAIAELVEAKRHYATQWVAFATARAPNPNDTCIVEQLSGNMAQASYPLASLLADYTKADSFRLRTVGN